jgi:hypothetical protein
VASFASRAKNPFEKSDGSRGRTMYFFPFMLPQERTNDDQGIKKLLHPLIYAWCVVNHGNTLWIAKH